MSRGPPFIQHPLSWDIDQSSGVDWDGLPVRSDWGDTEESNKVRLLSDGEKLCFQRWCSSQLHKGNHSTLFVCVLTLNERCKKGTTRELQLLLLLNTVLNVKCIQELKRFFCNVIYKYSQKNSKPLQCLSCHVMPVFLCAALCVCVQNVKVFVKAGKHVNVTV